MDKKWIETFQQGIELGYNNDWMEIGIGAFNTEPENCNMPELLINLAVLLITSLPK